VTSEWLHLPDNGSPSLGASETIIVTVTGPTSVLPVMIDIKPGGFPNSINLDNQGVLPVAILSVPGFDATRVDTRDLSRIRFGDVLLPEPARVSPVRFEFGDVDGDGDLDLVLFFSVPAIKARGALNAHSTLAELTGFTLDGTAFRGTDSVRII
jgi:hypothetical protein